MFVGLKGLQSNKVRFGAFWSLLEQSWAWNESHMLGAKGMDEIEDLKMLGFLINEGFLIEDGFLEE